jgi:hypothetical protein
MKKILVLIALVVVSISYAQNIRLEGTVQENKTVFRNGCMGR